jgi:hypothetical protein
MMSVKYINKRLDGKEWLKIRRRIVGLDKPDSDVTVKIMREEHFLADISVIMFGNC